MCARPTPVPESLPSPVRASPRLVPAPCSPSGRYQTASVVVSDASYSAVASTPLRLRLVPQPPRASTARPGSPRARTVALGRAQFHPQEVEPALPGRRVVLALAASLSSLARPPPPPAPLQARGGVALPVEGRGGPVAPATGLPPVSPYVPTPLSEAALAHLSPPPTTDPKPPPGPSGLGFPVRRRVRSRTAVIPLPHLLLPGTPASGGAVPGPPGYSQRVHTVADPPAGRRAVAGGPRGGLGVSCRRRREMS